MHLSELGEDANLQRVEGKVEVQNNHGKDAKPFDFSSLPPGYRFDPTDAEIVVYYLTKKIDHQPLPPNKIIEVNLYAHYPEDLAARYEPSGKDEWFYFTPRYRKYQNGRRPNRSVGDGGYWKATGADKEIKFEDRIVGYRKALVFHRGRPPSGNKTNWMMHEFKVAEPPEPPRRTGVDDTRLDDCVLCRVFRRDDSGYRHRKRSRDKSGVDESSSRSSSSSSSSSKIPRLELNPNEANNQFTLSDGMESVEQRTYYQYNPYISSHQALQNQQQELQPISQIPRLELNHNEANNQLTVGDGMTSVQQSYQYHPYINSHQALQNQQQEQQPIRQIPAFANAVFPQFPQYPQDNLQVLPPAGSDVSFHGQNNNLMQPMEFAYPDHSWDSDFRRSNIANAVFVSTMDLNPGYISRGNTSNTGLATNDPGKPPFL